MKRISLTTAVLICILSAQAQENLGIANSNYAGTDGVYINPSSIVDSKVFLDIRIVGASAFLHNNYIYLPKEDFYFPRDIGKAFPEPLDKYNGRNKYGYMDVAAHLPAFTLSIGDHGFGFHADVRSITGAYNVPQSVAKFAYEGLNYNPQHLTQFDEKNFFGNSMSFAEFGLSYGFILKKFNRELVTVGITGKYLVGFMGAGFDVKEGSFQVLDDEDMVVSNFDGELGYASGWGSGKGVGVDIGFTYKRMMEDVTHYSPHTKAGGCKTADYKWKIGASLLDVGRVKFNRNTTHQTYSTASTYWANYDTTTVTDVNSTGDVISGQFVEGVDVVTKNHYNSWLPVAGSVQFDYNLGKNFYINSTLVQGIRFPGMLTSMRPNLISVTPRYERKRFEVAMPVSLVHFQYPQFGLMLRLNNLVIGTDRLSTYLFNWDVYGADIYFTLKVPIFKNPACNDRSRNERTSNKGTSKGGKRKKKNSANSCPAYGINY